MAYGLSNGHVTDDGQTRDPNTLRAQYRENSLRHQTTTNRKWHMGYQMITWPMTSRDPQSWCEAVRSVILATLWLLVIIIIDVFCYGRRARENRLRRTQQRRLAVAKQLQHPPPAKSMRYIRPICSTNCDFSGHDWPKMCALGMGTVRSPVAHQLSAA